LIHSKKEPTLVYFLFRTVRGFFYRVYPKIQKKNRKHQAEVQFEHWLITVLYNACGGSGRLNRSAKIRGANVGSISQRCVRFSVTLAPLLRFHQIKDSFFCGCLSPNLAKLSHGRYTLLVVVFCFPNFLIKGIHIAKHMTKIIIFCKEDN
jgi:hypothetical protein